jgi:putative flippase GtrA
MIRNPLAHPIVAQGLRFALVGIANTLLGLGTVYACLFLLGWSDVVANVTGYTLGLIQSFALNRNWTFRSQVRILPGLMRFLAVFAVSYGCNLALVLTLLRLGIAPVYAHAAGMPLYTLIFFVLSRSLVFHPAKTD